MDDNVVTTFWGWPRFEQLDERRTRVDDKVNSGM